MYVVSRRNRVVTENGDGHLIAWYIEEYLREQVSNLSPIISGHVTASTDFLVGVADDLLERVPAAEQHHDTYI